MREIVPQKMDSRQLKWLMLVLVGGLVCGMIPVFVFLRLPLTYATILSAGLVFPVVALVVGDSKRLLLAALATLLPITVEITPNHTGYVGDIAGYIVSLYDAVLVVLYLMWFGEMVYGRREYQIRFFPAISIPAILLVLVAWASTLVAERQDLSIYANIQVIKLYLTFFYLANNIRSESEVRFLVLVLMLGLLFEGALGFAQHRYDEPFWPSALGGRDWIDSRVAGTWRSYNDFAWYLTFVLPISLSMFFGERSLSWRVVCSASLLFGSAALMWTNSRGGWISFAAGLAFVGVFVLLKTRGKRMVAGRFFVCILVVLLAVPIYPRLYSKVAGRFLGDDKGSAQSRMPQFEMAYNMMKENPGLGVGINNYAIVMEQYDYSEEGIESHTEHAVHNIYLHLGVEMGLLGLSVFLWCMMVVFVSGIGWIGGNSSFGAYAVIGLMGGILAFLVHGLADVAYYGGKLYLIVWFFAGMIYGIKNVGEEGGRAMAHGA